MQFWEVLNTCIVTHDAYEVGVHDEADTERPILKRKSKEELWVCENAKSD